MKMKKFVALLAVFALALLTTVSAGADGPNRWVKFHNLSDTVVTHLYGSNVGTDSWEEDILGSKVLRPGQKLNVDFNDGTGHCLFDIKVVFAGGDWAKLNDVNVCTQSDLYIY